MPKMLGRKRKANWKGIPERTNDYREGYLLAKRFFYNFLRTGELDGRSMESSASETVADAIRCGKEISYRQISTLRMVLKPDDSDWQRGIYDFLIGKIKTYNNNPHSLMRQTK